MDVPPFMEVSKKKLFQKKLSKHLAVTIKSLTLSLIHISMGGQGSIVDMIGQKMANLDYTHINFKGGKHLAGILFETLMYGKAVSYTHLIPCVWKENSRTRKKWRIS